MKPFSVKPFSHLGGDQIDIMYIYMRESYGRVDPSRPSIGQRDPCRQPVRGADKCVVKYEPYRSGGPMRGEFSTGEMGKFQPALTKWVRC